MATNQLRAQGSGLRKTAVAVVISAFCFLHPELGSAASGTEGAAFLDIPVGGGPAAMGAAYTALANDAYAVNWNPGGLGFLDATEVSGQHLSYLDTLHYEYLSFSHPLGNGGIGGSVQYLGSGDVAGRDLSGNSIGDFSSYYSAYNLAYGRSVGAKLSLGLTGKWIHAKLDDVSGDAFAADLGSMYQFNSKLMLGATLTNLGSQLKFLSEGDSLPMAFHLGAAYRPSTRWLLASEFVYPKTGLASFHVGGEWRPLEMLALRTGYRTDTVKGLSPLAGYTLGLGIVVWEQELAYAWLPYGDLGSTHYISLLMKFGQVQKSKRQLIQYHQIKKHRSAEGRSVEQVPDEQQLMELLSDDRNRVAQERKLP